MAPKKQPSAGPKKGGTSSRLLRTLVAFLVCILPVASLFFATAIVNRNMWLVEKGSVSSGLSVGQDPVSWTEFSPMSNYCQCENNHKGYCNERNDAFAGSSYLSVVILAAQALLSLLLVLELTSYGLYGGTHTTTKVSMILSLIVLATQLLSVISFYTAYSDRHCGDDSFKERGASLGWAFYFRGFEMIITIGIIGFTIKSFSRSHRGPPCGPILVQMLFNIISSVSAFSRNWMTLETTTNGGATQYYSTWSACTCFDPCDDTSDMQTTMTTSYALTIIQLIFAFITVFFMVLRAVDNEGASLKFAQGFSVLTSCVMIGNIANIAVKDWKISCASTGSVEFQYFSSVEFLLLSFCCQVGFAILNALYMLPACTFCSTPLPSKQGTKKVFHVAWWDHLKDAKTIAHEIRAEGDDDEDVEESSDDFSDDDDDDDDVEMSPAVVKGNGETPPPNGV